MQRCISCPSRHGRGDTEGWGGCSQRTRPAFRPQPCQLIPPAPHKGSLWFLGGSTVCSILEAREQLSSGKARAWLQGAIGDFSGGIRQTWIRMNSWWLHQFFQVLFSSGFQWLIITSLHTLLLPSSFQPLDTAWPPLPEPLLIPWDHASFPFSQSQRQRKLSHQSNHISSQLKPCRQPVTHRHNPDSSTWLSRRETQLQARSWYRSAAVSQTYKPFPIAVPLDQLGPLSGMLPPPLPHPSYMHPLPSRTWAFLLPKGYCSQAHGAQLPHRSLPLLLSLPSYAHEMSVSLSCCTLALWEQDLTCLVLDCPQCPKQCLARWAAYSLLNE